MYDDVRDRYLAHFRDLARDIFARHPRYRSVILATGQYWCDEASDAVHDSIVASERELPLWPHLCARGSYEESPDVPGEHCGACATLYEDYLRWWHDNGEAIRAFEAFCHEGGNQEEPDYRNALPAALARRDGDDVLVTVLGPVQRPDSILSGDDDIGAPDPMWADPRALELYAQVCATPQDNGPRRVLADYLLERELPRGELLAYGLEPGARAKYDELVAASLATWTHPLARYVPLATVKLERGFLAEAEVNIHEAAARRVRGLPVWNSVERLVVHEGSACILDPAMRALRELGRIGESWLADLTATDVPWAIETLDLDLRTDAGLELLVTTATLPALRHLVLDAIWVEEELARLATAPWWPQLARLSILDTQGKLATWQRRRRELGVPWLAVRAHHTSPVIADGWEIAFGPDDACEVTLRGFTPDATRDALAALLAQVTVPLVKLVPSRYYAPSEVDAAYLARDGRVVTI